MNNKTTIEQTIRLGVRRGPRSFRGCRILSGLLLLLLFPLALSAQIKIGGNVYGGGNAGNVGGSSSVTVKQGDLNKVFGGARMANVGGNAYVNIDGANATGYMLINYLFGGNDMAGSIGTIAALNETLPENEKKTLPEEIKNNTDGVDDTYNTYVHLSSKVTDKGEASPDAEKVFIGWLFAGGNGDYAYTSTTADGKTTHNIYQKEGDATPIATKVTNGSEDFKKPDLNKTYLDLQGGTIAFAHGGGNNATINDKTVIHMDNPSEVVVSITDEEAKTDDNPTGELLTEDRVANDMNISLVMEKYNSKSFQIGRLFGGNNKAEMAIRPTWNLQGGRVRNLYSGGNKGKMTSPEGLLLEIDPLPNNLTPLVINNVYGGCRMADVIPTVNGVYTPCTNLQDKDENGNLIYKFPNELAARVLIRGGQVNNVYGGNDVTGKVFGGNAVGIYATIEGDVYGGGNGAYVYTDKLENDKDYGDYYFPSELTGNGVGALNAYRPNAEQVSIRLKGKDADHPTIIKGSVFVGGNCATLNSTKPNPLIELKIGSHVLADKVFLGNNGAGMVEESVLEQYADPDFSDLRFANDLSVFTQYMEGVTMRFKPDIVFDNTDNGDPADYEDLSSKIGSFYCGGNVGSMAIAGKSTYTIDRRLVIFDKFVAGCNNANVPAKEGMNPAYEGGVLGGADEDNTEIKDRIELTLDNMLIVPQRWNDTFTLMTVKKLVAGKDYYTSSSGAGFFIADGTETVTAANQYFEKEGLDYVAVNPNTLNAGQEYYKTNLRSSVFVADGTEVFTGTGAETYYELTTHGEALEWNTAMWDVDEDYYVKTGNGGTGDGTDGTGTSNDKVRRLLGGNVYGGCYNSGHVNGNVIININHDVLDKDVIFAETDGNDEYTISGARNTGVLREAQGDDVQAIAMTVYGAGYGKETEIWGSTTVNLNNGYVFQAFGGGEEGIVGKKTEGEYQYETAYSSTVNLQGPTAGYSEDEDGASLAEAEYLFGGGNKGDVCGDTYVHLGNGRVYDAFGGACNANILGGTEVIIGYNGGFPWVRDNVYGGNDFGGIIKGNKNHTMATTRNVFDQDMLKSSTYVNYLQGRVDSIFGGNYGSYDYANPVYKDYVYYRGETNIPDGKAEGAPREGSGFSFPHINDNSFAHFTPTDNSNNIVGHIFGGSRGYPDHANLNNSMQEEAYVLIDDTKTKDASRYANVDFYGGGAFAGAGRSGLLGAGRTAVDLFAGSFNNIYGGCNQEGLVGYTRVNVPAASTAKVNAIFGGGKGYDPDLLTAKPELASRYCDHYVTCVDFKSTNVIVNDAIYGGNENSRISCDTYVNIEAPVLKSNGEQGFVYGAGYGRKTVSGRTNVFMNNNAVAYKVFGGGRDGNSFNFVSLQRWLANQFAAAGANATDAAAKVTAYGDILRTFGTYLANNNRISLPANTGTYVNSSGSYDGTFTNDIMTNTAYHQTNVHLMNGSNVTGYAYGGGFGTTAVVGGTTYIELKGGNVDKDIYGGGQGGSVYDEFGIKTFTAATNVYIEGGMARNVYGGGYLGHVGRHDGDISDSNVNDIPAEAHVTIGKVDGTSFYNGIPAIMRNAYGGGEGGSVYGTANLTINNGYIGYRYKNIAGEGQAAVYQYVEELDDQKTDDIVLAGNAFGGGYVVNSYVDNANVNMFGGTIRGSLYGGGEVGPIGRGTMKAGATIAHGGLKNGPANSEATIYKAGKTNVKMYNGHVLRNVFGGGRGKDSWGGDGTKFMKENMTEEEYANLDLKCKGYVFGQTEVNIYGGEVGTDEGMASGFGNVFGGGDEGSVYSAYEDASGNLRIGKKRGKRYNEGLTAENADYKYEGYYFQSDGTTYFTKPSSTDLILTEDCKVVVEPWLQVKNTAIDYNGKTYPVSDYVPTDYLNTLKAKSGNSWPSEWDNVDAGKSITIDGETVFQERGIHIHNAVFAGGNIASGSSSMYANETTVFGNATASIHDVYNRDLITIGTGHTGGLYGDGNLTFVDGYRELNITNYGTDKWHLAPELSTDAYKLLPSREKAYYELKYKALQAMTDTEGTTYSVGSTLPEDEILILFAGTDKIGTDGKPNPTYWQENGVVSTYAGRIMNTIQRADFCGVFGSRMVMKGARDRVPEIVDQTNYTINRVREVSLNKMDSPAGDTDADNKMHGNYFGIYSIVNYLGALTSDVDFHTYKRTTQNAESKYKESITLNGETITYGNATFEQWKEAHKTDRMRNNGNCHNQLALASGVYLELTTEKSTGNTLDKKDWGLITGVVELDLINVQPGIGGGFVYAKNEHGKHSSSGTKATTLTALNKNAVTQWDFNYATPDANREEWETSGNFIHSSQTIIDDCYNVSGRYLSTKWVPAHYWYISGQVYVYDQYISAYTGSPNAYSKNVEIPITINAASNGTMTLMDVQPNLYAYYSSYTSESSNVKLQGDSKLVINDVTYQLNDPISYWEWNKLSKAEQKLFVRDTYVVTGDCKIGSTPYTAGTVLLKSEYDALGTPANVTKKTLVNDVETYVESTFDEMFHSSNNMSHDTGYLLTYNMTNPDIWNKWYTQVEDSKDEQGNYFLVKNQTGGNGFEDGPTYHPISNGLYGQKAYDAGDIITQEVYDTYNNVDAQYIPNHGLTETDEHYDASKKQATFVQAYVVTKEYTDATRHLYPGAAVASEISGYTAPAYVCTSTIKLSDSEFIYVNELMSESQKTEFYNRFKNGTDAEELIANEINNMIVPAYYCTEAGLYGGDYYDSKKNYRALAAWSSMSEADRKNFKFNYDAFDLLIDPTYSLNSVSKRYQYDGEGFTTAEKAKTNKATYSLKTSIDYTATYNGNDSLPVSTNITLQRDNNTISTNTVQKNDELNRTAYESLPNEQRHYAPIVVDAAGDYYVINNDFVHIETPYAAGKTITEEEYGRLSDSEKANVTKLTITDKAIKDNGNDAQGNKNPFYFCRDKYTIGGTGTEYAVNHVTDITATTYVKGNNDVYSDVDATNTNNYTSGTVPVGLVIYADNYGSLVNKQKNFTIHGVSPLETSTLFVSRNSDINDLSTEKIITVIYKYDYEESDESGLHITPISERHVVNIHVTFKSGIPIVPDIQEPDIVLPGTSITLSNPVPTPGAYEILGGGWELFDTKTDAESHTNGKEYNMSSESPDFLYWYQDGFYLAYYAKTYLGKTYSNHVPVHVANYHDLKKVMDDKLHHLHVDYDRTRLKRDSKIYINDYTDSGKNGLDLLKDFFDLSVLSGTPAAGSSLSGHSALNTSTDTGINIYDGSTNTKGVKGCKNLEFFLRTDIDHSVPSGSPAWTPIGTGSNQCFEGILHGDGHTISGLAPATGTTGSLFSNLCGEVYNLGVTGSFTGAGVVDSGDGYVESCWVKTTAESTTANSKPYAVFGNPTDTKDYQQVVNSYFWDGNNALYNTTTNATTGITTSGGAHGTARAMSAQQFYNGELAYDLNNFYLYKRYCDKKVTTGAYDQSYQYFTINGENQPALQPATYYGSNPSFCSSGYLPKTPPTGYVVPMYVEDRYADGDFRYAAGTIPTSADERRYVDTEHDNKEYFFPLWPDDYIFFGQKLTYGYSTDAHQETPTAVTKDNGRLSLLGDANRVYRAPAYYRSKQMDVFHFNPNAYLAAKEKLTDAQIAANATARDAYPGMTAVDFAGHNDAAWALGSGGLSAGKTVFCPPLLDDDGLTGIVNCDETRNLLVYAPAATAATGYANKATHDVLTDYFDEPAYSDHYSNDKYRKVADATTDLSTIYGHLVKSTLTTANDHLLVDKEEFNCPIAYQFGKDYRMWYQRIPDPAEYVDFTKGWQSISIPFTAELVTTNDKGEITHFYSGSTKSANSDAKIGHEYWLREFRGITTAKEGNPEKEVARASFRYPDAAGADKDYTNTFLWDYYYQNESTHNQKDANKDTYLEYRQYYKSTHTHPSYPLLASGTPYILGLPSATYYEFDLSGNFTAQNTAVSIDKLKQQVITFASDKGIGIDVSDDENSNVKKTVEGTGKNYTFTFHSNYLKQDLSTSDYTLKADGSQYDKVTAEGGSAVIGGATALPFRPYFTATATAKSESRRALPESILFDGDYDGLEDEPTATLDGALVIYAKGHSIFTTSHLKEATTVRIINVNGITLTDYVLQPGETVETPVRTGGIYIVNKKKLLVR